LVTTNPIVNNSVNQFEGRIGFVAGIDVRIGDKFFLMPGLYFLNLTTDIVDVSAIDPTVIGETSHRVIKLPLNVGTKLLPLDVVSVYLKGGIVPTFKMGDPDYGNIPGLEDIQQNFNFGGNLGLGVDVAILNVEVNYEWGLSNMFENSDVKSNIVSVLLGLRF